MIEFVRESVVRIPLIPPVLFPLFFFYSFITANKHNKSSILSSRVSPVPRSNIAVYMKEKLLLTHLQSRENAFNWKPRWCNNTNDSNKKRYSHIKWWWIDVIVEWLAAHYRYCKDSFTWIPLFMIHGPSQYWLAMHVYQQNFDFIYSVLFTAL